MKIKFLHAYQGALTGELCYLEGDVAEFSEETAQHIIDNDHAVAADASDEPTPEPKPKKDKMFAKQLGESGVDTGKNAVVSTNQGG